METGLSRDTISIKPRTILDPNNIDSVDVNLTEDPSNPTTAPANPQLLQIRLQVPHEVRTLASWEKSQQEIVILQTCGKKQQIM